MLLACVCNPDCSNPPNTCVSSWDDGCGGSCTQTPTGCFDPSVTQNPACYTDGSCRDPVSCNGGACKCSSGSWVVESACDCDANSTLCQSATCNNGEWLGVVVKCCGDDPGENKFAKGSSYSSTLDDDPQEFCK